jgi:putative NADPH-quinone reductase
MKTLVIVAHPDMQTSKMNKRWIAELRRHPGRYHIHDLYARYPDGKIDVQQEQQLLEAFDTIVFQFPFYWFNCTPLLKQWLDEVLTYGWAYGSNSGYKMSGKRIALAVSAGIDEEEYAPGRKYKYTLQQLLSPFELTFEYVRADYRGFFAYYGIELNSTDEAIEKGAAAYMEYLEALTACETLC